MWYSPQMNRDGVDRKAHTGGVWHACDCAFPDACIQDICHTLAVRNHGKSADEWRWKMNSKCELCGF